MSLVSDVWQCLYGLTDPYDFDTFTALSSVSSVLYREFSKFLESRKIMRISGRHDVMPSTDKHQLYHGRFYRKLRTDKDVDVVRFAEKSLGCGTYHISRYDELNVSRIRVTAELYLIISAGGKYTCRIKKIISRTEIRPVGSIVNGVIIRATRHENCPDCNTVIQHTDDILRAYNRFQPIYPIAQAIAQNMFEGKNKSANPSHDDPGTVLLDDLHLK